MICYQAPTYTKEQLAQLDESKIQFPFNDDDATYHGLEHQYQLTDKYFQERGRNLQVEIDGNAPDKVKWFLKALTNKVYTYIYTHNKSTRRQLNYMIAKGRLRGFSPYEYRQMFLEAMFIEGCYLLDNGDISNTTGVDFDTMQNMSQDVMRRQERDYHKDFIGIMKTLGLNYYGNYKFIPLGNDW